MNTDSMPLHEHLRTWSRHHPDKPAFIWYGREISWRELDAASDAFAARLAAIGVRRGEPLALFLNNCPQYVMAHAGIQKLGAIVCPCGPLNKEHELEYQLSDLGARVIVAATALLGIVEKVLATTKLAHVFTVGYADLLPDAPTLAVPAELLQLKASPPPIPAALAAISEDFLAATRSGATAPAVDIVMDDVALMTYTSGSTGLPKGAMLSYRNARFKTGAAADCNGIGNDAVLLAVAPLYHIAGMVLGLNVPLYTGATTVLLYRFDPRTVLQAITRYRVSWWYSIAPMNVAVMQVPGAADYDMTSLRGNPVTSFGISFTEALAKQWQAFAPNVVCFEGGYGLSETHTVDTYFPADGIHWGTHGKVIPGGRIRILDPDTGRELPPGEQGEIVLNSPGVFKGYWNKPEATAKTLRDGWVHTGDMGKVDADGYLTFMGRFKEMIKVSGYSVFPEEVETILILHPGIAQAAVLGVADAEKGEVVRAFVVLKPGALLTEAELIAWSRDHMAPYKAPRQVRFLDALPATGAGKVLRRLLKDND